uniref:Uncharacterized protein n=1 Tax=Rhizophora mucronata TaxID=61149 RepID=A0A2P2NTG9_RHIMU
MHQHLKFSSYLPLIHQNQLYLAVWNGISQLEL